MNKSAKFYLFIIAYLPLLLIIVIKQVESYWDDLFFQFTTPHNYYIFLKSYWLSCLILILIPLSCFQVWRMFKDATQYEDQLQNIKISKIANLSNETLSYLSTYIIPFVFNDYSKFSNIIAVVIFIFVIYSVYTKSNLIAINPTLAYFKSIYILSSDTSNKTDYIAISNKRLEVNDIVKFHEDNSIDKLLLIFK